MIKRLNIRQRILGTFIAIVLIGSLIQLVLAGRQLQLATLEFYRHHLETDVLMAASSLSEPLEHYQEGEGTSSLQQVLATLQQDTSRDYLIVDHNYRIIAYTINTGYERLEHIGPSPELTTASEGGIGDDIRTDFEGFERLYVAVRIQYEGNTLGYLVLSRLMRPAYITVYQQWAQLSSISLPVIVLVVVAGLWLSATISRPIRQLRNSALKMAEGALDTRIVTDAQDEVGQLGRAFNYMAEKIENLMKTQRNFVSNAAHELRTPLMTLKLRVEALEDETLPSAERAAYLTEIREEIDHMAGLVGSLLVLARIDEGRHNGSSYLTDTSAALSDITRHWRIEARREHLEFEAEIPADLPGICLPPEDLRLILDNLFGNALKYTPQGKIGFSARRDEQTVILYVRDTGIGFDPQGAEHLFTRFYRADAVRSHFEGNGLGLSIVAAIVEQYGGSVSAESAGPGKGATFTVQVPILKTQPQPLLHSSPA